MLKLKESVATNRIATMLCNLQNPSYIKSIWKSVVISYLNAETFIIIH